MLMRYWCTVCNKDVCGAYKRAGRRETMLSVPCDLCPHTFGPEVFPSPGRVRVLIKRVYTLQRLLLAGLSIMANILWPVYPCRPSLSLSLPLSRFFSIFCLFLIFHVLGCMRFNRAMPRFKYRHSSIKLSRNDETRISGIRIENILLEACVDRDRTRLPY